MKRVFTEGAPETGKRGDVRVEHVGKRPGSSGAVKVGSLGPSDSGKSAPQKGKEGFSVVRCGATIVAVSG